MIDSPEDLADRCYNCGRLYYRFTPSTERATRESKLVIRRHYSPGPSQILNIFLEAGGTLHTSILYRKMKDDHQITDRRVRQLLDQDTRFSNLGRGWWTLTGPAN